MAIRVVHGPSAGLVGGAAFAGGLGQFGRFRMQLRQQERLQQRQIEAARGRQERALAAQFEQERQRRQDTLERETFLANQRERLALARSAEQQQAIVQQQAQQQAEFDNRLELQRLRNEGAGELDVFRWQLNRIREKEKQSLQQKSQRDQIKFREQRRMQQGQDAVQWVDDQADWDDDEKAAAKRQIELKFFAGGVDVKDDPDIPDIDKAISSRTTFDPDMNGNWVLQPDGRMDFKPSKRVAPKEEKDPQAVTSKEVNDLVRQAFADIGPEATPEQVEQFVKTRLELRNRLLGRMPSAEEDEEDEEGLVDDLTDQATRTAVQEEDTAQNELLRGVPQPTAGAGAAAAGAVIPVERPATPPRPGQAVSARMDNESLLQAALGSGPKANLALERIKDRIRLGKMSPEEARRLLQ